MEEFQKKLREKTPIGKLDQTGTHPYQEKEPLEAFPNDTNPITGEVGGPRGPEPTRYGEFIFISDVSFSHFKINTFYFIHLGDWERKGRVSDF